MPERRGTAHAPAPPHLQEARRLIALCAGNAGDAGAIVNATETVCARVVDYLDPLIGRNAAQALLARAVYLSKPQFALRGTVSTGEAQIANVAAELVSHLRAADADVGLAAAADVLARFIGLLTGLIGEELGMRLLREACPDLDEEQS